MSFISSGNEISFDKDRIIVSKTDLKGKITYGNELFIELSGYSEKELLGSPHSMIRHEKMPKTVFRILWNGISKGKEIFAYVVNRAKNGDYYWVFANVTPSFNSRGDVVGYHSVRRKPKQEAIAAISELYGKLLDIERRDGVDGGLRALEDILDNEGISYEEYIISI